MIHRVHPAFRPAPALAALLALVLTLVLPARATSVLAPATRAAFLRLLDRPRVPLAAEISAPLATIFDRTALLESTFTYAADATNRVPGLLVKPAASAGRRPAIIVLHGTGGKKEGELALLRDYAAAGFVAVAIDARHHGARRADPAAKDNSAYTDAIARAYRDAPAGEHPFFYDTVWDVMRLLDWLVTRDDIDPARLGLIGFSKGGIETYLAAAADPRLAVAVSCLGVQSFRWAVENHTWHSRIGTIQAAFDTAAKTSAITPPDAAFVHAFYARVAPGLDTEFDGPVMLPLVVPRPFLAINGDSDPRTPLPGLALCTAAARAAYHAARADEKFSSIIQPATGHTVNPDSLAAARVWFIRWLRPTP